MKKYVVEVWKDGKLIEKEEFKNRQNQTGFIRYYVAAKENYRIHSYIIEG